MDELYARGEKVGALLKARGETIAIAESSTGGLISAALLAVPGASAYFLGGAVVYTLASRSGLMGIAELPSGMRASTEAYALLLARTAKARIGASWALSETGASGPTGNRYGDAAGHSCFAVAGPREASLTLETGTPDRRGNMHIFAAAALDLLARTLSAT
ncbi:MAG TPA: CinA family protein [Stellaceae bacterium]|nr:CinA family protein [Stellaceae bacterium]